MFRSFCLALACVWRLASAQNETRNDSRALLIQAQDLLQEKRIEEAAAVLQRVVAADPLHPEANYNLGSIALLENRPAEALPRFRAVLKRNPKDISALTGLLEAEL